MSQMKQAGVDVLVSMLQPAEAAELDLSVEAEMCAAGGIEFRSFPIPDRETPSSTAAFAKFVEELRLKFMQDAAMEKREMGVIWCDSSIDAKSPSHWSAARISHGRKVAISDKWNGRLNLESFSVRFLTFGVVTPLSTGSSVGSLLGRTLQMTNTGPGHLETWNVACNVAKLELPTQTLKSLGSVVQP